MKVGIISDTHNRLSKENLSGEEEFIISAGDICDAYDYESVMDSLGLPYVGIAGNHEYYGHEYESVNIDVFNNSGRMFENFTVEVGDTSVHMCTLWTNIENEFLWYKYKNGLNDCRFIRGWTYDKYKNAYDDSVRFINENVKEGDVVVTHHSPSSQSVDPKFIGNDLNFCFHSDLDDVILNLKPSIWVHGHMHDACDYLLGDTRIICNPMGYRFERSASNSYKAKIVDL